MKFSTKWASAAAAAIVTTMITSGVALAAVQERPHPGRGPIGPLAEADANKDGEVSRAEWLKIATDRFNALDTNKDGKIVWSELPRPPRNLEGPRGGRGGRGGFEGRGGPGRGGPDGGRGWGHMPPPPPGAAPQAETPKLAPNK